MIRRWVPLTLLIALIALTPLAQASPPDQSWLSGVYDNADYDDVVLLVTSAVSVTSSDPPWSLGFSSAVIAAVVSRASPSGYAAPSFHTAPRAPPLS